MTLADIMAKYLVDATDSIVNIAKRYADGLITEAELHNTITAELYEVIVPVVNEYDTTD